MSWKSGHHYCLRTQPKSPRKSKNAVSPNKTKKQCFQMSDGRQNSPRLQIYSASGCFPDCTGQPHRVAGLKQSPCLYVPTPRLPAHPTGSPPTQGLNRPTGPPSSPQVLNSPQGPTLTPGPELSTQALSSPHRPTLCPTNIQ